MTGPGSQAVELGSGTGVVAAVGEAVLFVADGDVAEPLVEAVRDAAASGPRPGRLLARRLGALVTGDDAERVPGFGVLAAIDGGWVALLHGLVAATIVGADGREEVVSGDSSVTWTDRIVPATAEAVLLGPVGLARPGASPLRLERGVVPGGWLRVVLAHHEPTEVPPSAFEQFSLSPDGVEARAPLPIEGVTSFAPDPPDTGSPTSPHVISGSPVDIGEPAARPPRPSLGLLVFDDGSAFALDDDYVLGREPEVDELVAAGNARPIALDDPDDTVSRVHAAIRVVEPDVQLIDRGSTNGTHVWDASKGSWDRLTPGEPRIVEPGQRGAIGRRTFVYEAAAGLAPQPPEPRPAPTTVTVERPVGSLVREDGAVHPLDRSYVIGREPLSDDSVRRAVASPIVLRDDQISRVHAHVSVTDGTVTVRDAGTPGGTFIAAPGAPEWDAVGEDPTELPPGWSLRIGAHVFTFRAGR